MVTVYTTYSNIKHSAYFHRLYSHDGEPSLVGLCSRDPACLFWGRNFYIIWLNLGLWSVGLVLMCVRTNVAVVPFLTSNVGFPCHQNVSFHRGTNEHVSHATSRDLHIRVLQLPVFSIRFSRTLHFCYVRSCGEVTSTWPPRGQAGLLQLAVRRDPALIRLCYVEVSYLL
jgi:hypothetical protein